MDFKIDELIPPALLKVLEKEDKSLIHTKDGWFMLPSSSILSDSTLTEIKERLDRIEDIIQGDKKKF